AAAADQNGHALFEQVRHSGGRQVQPRGIVARTVQERKAAKNQIARQRQRRFFSSELHHGLYARIKDRTEIPAIAGVTEPKKIREDLSHYIYFRCRRTDCQSVPPNLTSPRYSTSISPHARKADDRPPRATRRSGRPGDWSPKLPGGLPGG